MEFVQVKGNTWAIVGSCYMPVYRVNERDCILMDTGYPSERGELEAILEQEGLQLLAIICTHAHIDHIGSAAYFQEKYQIPIYLSQAEAGIMCSLLNTKAYRIILSPEEVRKEMGDTLSRNVQVIPYGTELLTLSCGVNFGIEWTEGHSSEHICVITADDVCYVGDAVLTKDQLQAKFPYALDIAGAMKSHDKIAEFPYSHYIMAHFGECIKDELPSLAYLNKALFQLRAEEIYQYLDTAKTIDRLTLDLCKEFSLNVSKPKRVYFYQRTIRFFLEYLEDLGRITMLMTEDGLCYQQTVLDEG